MNRRNWIGSFCGALAGAAALVGLGQRKLVMVEDTSPPDNMPADRWKRLQSTHANWPATSP